MNQRALKAIVINNIIHGKFMMRKKWDKEKYLGIQIFFNLDRRKETRREESKKEKRWRDKRKTMEIMSHRSQGKVPF